MEIYTEKHQNINIILMLHRVFIVNFINTVILLSKATNLTIKLEDLLLKPLRKVTVA